MIPTSIARAPTMLRASGIVLRPVARPALGSIVVAKRFNQQENRGGKSKLIFRIGLRDIPVELYPILFITGVALVGAGIAIGRHLYYDGLRIFPAASREKAKQHPVWDSANPNTSAATK